MREARRAFANALKVVLGSDDVGTWPTLEGELDLRQLRFLDSTGIRLLVSGRTEAQRGHWL